MYITHDKKDLAPPSTTNQICLSSHELAAVSSHSLAAVSSYSLAAVSSHSLAASNTVNITVAYPATNVSYTSYPSDTHHSEPYLTCTAQQQQDTQTSLSYNHYSETG